MNSTPPTESNLLAECLSDEAEIWQSALFTLAVKRGVLRYADDTEVYLQFNPTNLTH